MQQLFVFFCSFVVLRKIMSAMSSGAFAIAMTVFSQALLVVAYLKNKLLIEEVFLHFFCNSYGSIFKISVSEAVI